MHSIGLPRKLGKLIISSESYNMDFIKKLPKIIIYDLKYDVIKDVWEIVFHHESLMETMTGADVPVYQMTESTEEGKDEYIFYY